MEDHRAVSYRVPEIEAASALVTGEIRAVFFDWEEANPGPRSDTLPHFLGYVWEQATIADRRRSGRPITLGRHVEIRRQVIASAVRFMKDELVEIGFLPDAARGMPPGDLVCSDAVSRVATRFNEWTDTRLPDLVRKRDEANFSGAHPSGDALAALVEMQQFFTEVVALEPCYVAACEKDMRRELADPIVRSPSFEAAVKSYAPTIARQSGGHAVDAVQAAASTVAVAIFDNPGRQPLGRVERGRVRLRKTDRLHPRELREVDGLRHKSSAERTVAFGDGAALDEDGPASVREPTAPGDRVGARRPRSRKFRRAAGGKVAIQEAVELTDDAEHVERLLTQAEATVDAIVERKPPKHQPLWRAVGELLLSRAHPGSEPIEQQEIAARFHVTKGRVSHIVGVFRSALDLEFLGAA